MISLFLGLKGSGKTTAALKLMYYSPRKVIIFSPCPDASNEYLKWMQKIKYVRDSDGPEVWNRAAKKEKALRIYQFQNNPDVFEWLKDQKDTDILIDDARSVFSNTHIRNASLNWNPYVRWRGQRVFITCHFAIKDLAGNLSKWRESSDRIIIFGPYQSEDQIKQLYDMRHSNIQYPDFQHAIWNSPIRNPLRVI